MFQILDQMASCWHYVGTFIALGRLFFVLGRFLDTSSALSARLGRFFRVAATSRLDFGAFRDGFGGSDPLFFMDFCFP